MTQHYTMLQRNLLYTGVTRGKKLVVLVGQKKAVAIAVRSISGRRRWSKLANGWQDLKGKHATPSGLPRTRSRWAAAEGRLPRGIVSSDSATLLRNRTTGRTVRRTAPLFRPLVAYFDFAVAVLNLSHFFISPSQSWVGQFSAFIRHTMPPGPGNYIVAKQNVRASDHKNTAYGNRNGGFH